MDRLNPILELQAAMSAASARLAALEETQKMMLRAQTEAMTETTALRGIFASIEGHLVRLFESDQKMQAWAEAMERRVQALESRQPPAA